MPDIFCSARFMLETMSNLLKLIMILSLDNLETLTEASSSVFCHS